VQRFGVKIAIDDSRGLADRLRPGMSLANQQFRASAISNLDLLTAQEALIAAEEQVAVSDAAVVQDQVAIFKAPGGGWATEVGR
jgi:outer membrane protein TolC